MAKVTLKMIAERCGVSTAVVSACLNGKNKKIGCSPAKAEEIRKAVAEMNYVPSVFARSIRTKEVPIIGALFYAEVETWQLHQRYFQAHLMEMTFLFNREDLDVTFIPYHSEEEQLKRLQRVISCGMIGGVVSNIMTHSHVSFCNYLKECGLPYMVMGTPSVEGVYSVDYDLDDMASILNRLFLASGLKYCFRVFVRNGEAVFFSGISDVFSWNPNKMFTLNDIRGIAGDAYFIIPGHEILNYMRYQGFSPPHILLCEQASEYLMPSPEYDLVVADVQSNRIHYIATALSRWMKYGEKPENISHLISDYEAIRIFPRLRNVLRRRKETECKNLQQGEVKKK